MGEAGRDGESRFERAVVDLREAEEVELRVYGIFTRLWFENKKEEMVRDGLWF